VAVPIKLFFDPDVILFGMKMMSIWYRLLSDSTNYVLLMIS
jgi:hypothetical protein